MSLNVLSLNEARAAAGLPPVPDDISARRRWPAIYAAAIAALRSGRQYVAQKCSDWRTVSDCLLDGVVTMHGHIPGVVTSFDGSLLFFCRFDAHGRYCPARGYWVKPKDLKPLISGRKNGGNMTPEIKSHLMFMQVAILPLKETLQAVDEEHFKAMEAKMRTFQNGTMDAILPHYMSIQDMLTSQENLKQVIEISQCLRTLKRLLDEGEEYNKQRKVAS
ncbi:MAG: hypothetical protein AB7H77_09285 [Bdellovibrionales bacterium]